MDRAEFMQKVKDLKRQNAVMNEEGIRQRIHEHADIRTDIPVCIGELAELTLELTRFQRGKMDPDDFLQELSHVQWAIWSLQDIFGVPDEDVLAAV